MCGFSGVFNSDGLTAIDRSWLSETNQCLKHRGPDDSGLWISSDYRLGFAHRRLSIIDLSKKASQPMHYANSNLHLVFNGEIYNYKEIREQLLSQGFLFNSNSDSEVLLKSYAKWGKGCTSKFVGQFAFVIFDSKEKTLFLARDAAGEKPLYYSIIKNGHIIFSSEQKSLLIHSDLHPKLNHMSLVKFLSSGTVGVSESIIEGIERINPGSQISINLITFEISKSFFWKIPAPKKSSLPESLDSLVSKLESLLRIAIRRQFEADVPVGVLLSGGLDSSIIASLASQEFGHVNTFTASFPEDPNLDESIRSKLIAKAIGSNHHELEITKPSLDVIKFLGKNFDEPIFDISIVPTFLLSKEIKRSCSVALGGDGADEIFGGYIHHSRALRNRQQIHLYPSFVSEVLLSLAKKMIPFGVAGHYRLIQYFNDSSKTNIQDWRMFPLDEITKLLSLKNTNVKNNFLDFLPNLEIVERYTRYDFENYLPNDILVKLDRYSMLASLEMRSPFLDLDVIEFAFTQVPSQLKVQQGNRKIILKALGEKILPPNFDFNRKFGFTPPIHIWGKDMEWQSFMRQTLVQSESRLFNHDIVSHYFKNINKSPIILERLFILTLFQLWLNDVLNLH